MTTTRCSVLGVQRREKLDLDNLTKGTLDSLRGIVFDDDSQVDHLDLVKVRGTSDDEFIAIRVQPTALNEHPTDTFRQTLQVAWAGRMMLNLDDYLDE
ncbi:MAG: RusA family crossover junction endodeoxyribonuclease [Actinobacteria bacterium]|nr:RusA family crossover junction endodeoxyribonuclease [Actinomycetota bacterium]MCA1699785.1 RusA family crossover junction endodeoxyribonuclease [Actinomycetota bacterium]